MSEPTWEDARHLLDEYFGAATEIFVTAVPIHQLKSTMKIVASLPSVEVLEFHSENLTAPFPLDDKWISRVLRVEDSFCTHTFRSDTGGPNHLQILLDLDWEDQTMETELVFWNDLSFSPEMPIAERQQRLRSLCSLGTSLRGGAAGATCILTTEYNGPAEDLLENPNVIVW